MSTDEGASWSKGKALPGVGCVKPRLLMLGEKAANGALKKGAPAGPLILSGGRLCVENVTDVFVWLNEDGLAGAAGSKLAADKVWRKHSISYLLRQTFLLILSPSRSTDKLFGGAGTTTTCSGRATRCTSSTPP